MNDINILENIKISSTVKPRGRMSLLLFWTWSHLLVILRIGAASGSQSEDEASLKMIEQRWRLLGSLMVLLSHWWTNPGAYLTFALPVTWDNKLLFKSFWVRVSARYSWKHPDSLCLFSSKHLFFPKIIFLSLLGVFWFYFGIPKCKLHKTLSCLMWYLHNSNQCSAHSRCSINICGIGWMNRVRH